MNAYGRPIWTGPFFATSVQWGAHASPGNVEVLVACAQQADQRVRRPIIASMDDDLGLGPAVPRSAESATDLLAVWVGIGGHGEHGASEADLARLLAIDKHVPLLVYQDGPGGLTTECRDLLRPGDWAGVNGYPAHPRETAAETIARVYDNLWAAKDATGLVAFIRPLFTRNDEWTIAQVRALQDAYSGFIHDNTWIVADLWFAWARPSGALDHQEFRDMAATLAEDVETPALVAAQPPAPTPAPEPVPAPSPEPPTSNPDPQGELPVDYTKATRLSRARLFHEGDPSGTERIVCEVFPGGDGYAFHSLENDHYFDDQGGGGRFSKKGPLAIGDHNSRFRPSPVNPAAVLSSTGNPYAIF